MYNLLKVVGVVVGIGVVVVVVLLYNVKMDKM
jgi:hypothetical protein